MGCDHNERARWVCLHHAPDFLKAGDPCGYRDVVQAKQDNAEGREAIAKYQIAEILIGCEDQSLLGFGFR